MSVKLFGHNDFGLTSLFVEDGILQRLTLIDDGDFTLGVLADRDLGFTQSISGAGSLYLVDDFMVLQGKVLRKNTRFLEREDDVEFIF